MRKDFYIFRHGQTDYNLERRWQGCSLDIGLNKKGIAQAEEMALNLQDKNLEIIFCSHLKRAHQTAEIAAKHLGINITTIEDLREGCFGIA